MGQVVFKTHRLEPFNFKNQADHFLLNFKGYDSNLHQSVVWVESCKGPVWLQIFVEVLFYLGCW